MSNVSEIWMVFSQVHDDSGTSFNRILGIWDFKLAWAVGYPRVGIFALLSGNDFDLIGNDEGWIESDTELSNDVALDLLACFFQVFDVLFGAASGNGS